MSGLAIIAPPASAQESEENLISHPVPTSSPSLNETSRMIMRSRQLGMTESILSVVEKSGELETLSDDAANILTETLLEKVSMLQKASNRREIIRIVELALAKGIKTEQLEDAYRQAKLDVAFDTAVDKANALSHAHKYQAAIDELSNFELTEENQLVVEGWRAQLRNMELYAGAKKYASAKQYRSAINMFNRITGPFYYRQPAYKTAKTWEVALQKQEAAEKKARILAEKRRALAMRSRSKQQRASTWNPDPERFYQLNRELFEERDRLDQQRRDRQEETLRSWGF